MSDEFEDDDGASPEGVEMVVAGDEGGAACSSPVRDVREVERPPA